MTVFRAQSAWIDDSIVGDVDIHVDGSGFITAVRPSNTAPQDEIVELPGVVYPGFANAHSHAFHRALRGRTHGDGGTFWTWRQGMYRVAATLTPDSYYELARGVYAEMVLAGVTSVGEFHYVHHSPDGSPYADPNAMGQALIAAASDVGLRITLLDTCYLSGGLDESGHLPMQPEQLRFSDGSAEAWAERILRLQDTKQARIGAAIHSVRAVPRDSIRKVAELSGQRPLHIHVSEQPAENQACLSAYGCTPTELLAAEGALSARSTAVHATHLTLNDIALLGQSRTYSCFCPTTERDLADGIGPATALAAAGSPLCLGSDQHAVIDLLEEARALEMHERLITNQRGRFTPAEVVEALTATGHASLGWHDVGRIAVGQRADLVAVSTSSVRTAGSDPAQIVMSAYASDVDTVVIDGVVKVRNGRHLNVDASDVLATTIGRIWGPSDPGNNS
jgi:formiminoglutamate deiminase